MDHNAKGGVNDLIHFSGRSDLAQGEINYNLPLELQGIMDSMEVMQFIIFLEVKYSLRLTREEIQSISTYKDLIELLELK